MYGRLEKWNIHQIYHIQRMDLPGRDMICGRQLVKSNDSDMGIHSVSVSRQQIWGLAHRCAKPVLVLKQLLAYGRMTYDGVGFDSHSHGLLSRGVGNTETCVR